MKTFELALVAIVLFLIYKRVEGYRPVDANTKFDSQLDSLYLPGGRPAEFFNTFSPSEWAPRSPGYIFDDTVDMDV